MLWRATTGRDAARVRADPPSPQLSASALPPILAGVFAIGIFVVDTFIELSGAVAVLYVIVVLVTARHFPRRAVLAVTCVCLGLTVLSYALQHHLTIDAAFIRCVMSLAAIVITTALALRNQAANAALRERAELLDLTHDAILVRDMDEVITYWNRGAEELYGFSQQEAVGKTGHRLLQTVFPGPLAEINAELLRAGRWEGELVHTKRDGTPVTVSSRWSLQRDNRGQAAAILETNTDITERKRADLELRASERRYRNIFQSTGVSIWEEDFSRVKAAIDALKADGVTDFARYFATHPDFVRRTIAAVRVVDANDASLALIGARNKDELLASLPRVFTAETEQAFAGVLTAIAEGRTSFASETVLQTLENKTIAILFTVTMPPESANLESVLVSIIDVTERNKTQEALHEAQAQLAHVTRVTTLGELAASIAHEVNQPLAAIVTNGEAGLRWLGHATPNTEEVRRSVKRIVSDANRASQVIRRIRDLSRKADPEKTPLDINDVVDDVIPLVQRAAFSHHAALHRQLAAGLPLVLGDRVQLQQVMINLIVNGIEAMAGVTDRPREIVIRSRRDDTGEVLVEIEDAGVGIDPAQAARLYNAFYTTKRDGMGMGLSICRSIIEAHGGRISARPNAPHGAVFQVALPAAP